MMQWTRSFFTALTRSSLFLRLLFARFIDNQGFPHAASLTFTTLLSLVPLMTVVLAIFAAFLVFGGKKPKKKINAAKDKNL